MRNKISLTRNIIALVFVAVVATSTLYCHSTPPKTKVDFLHAIDTAKHYLNLNDTVKYVGAKTCKLCHQDIYNSFMQTGMGKSFDVASRQKSSAKFGPHAIVYDKFKDFYYHPYWENNKLYVLEYRLKGKDTVYKHKQEVNYIIGSGQHTNSHLYNINGYIFQIPITYYTQKGIWDLAPGFSGGYNSRFSREIGLECMTCHNSYPSFVQGSTNKFSRVPNGIACERCHGAGEVHVRAIQLGHIVDTTKAIDYTIVNPAKLPVELQIDVCQRCHLQGNAVLKPGKSFFDFKPGMHLSDVEDVFMPKYEGMENEFIMASHIERLKMSKCFIYSQNNMVSNSLKPYLSSLTCVTCHNPHVDVRSVSDAYFNNKCLNCHGGTEGGLNTVSAGCSEKMELRKKVNNDCVSCHMPKGKTIDIPHVITTDHYIRIPVKNKETEKIKKFITLYDVNNPHPSAYTRGRAFIQQYSEFEDDKLLLLDSAAHYFKATTYLDIRTNYPSLIEISFYKKDYFKILFYVNTLNPKIMLDSLLIHEDFTNNDAWTAYRIGEAYYALDHKQMANTFYSKAVKLAPFIPEFQNKLAVDQVALNHITEADKTISGAIKLDSNYVPALVNKGYIKLLKRNTALSKSYYDKALSFNPDDKQALLNTAGWYIYEKQYHTASLYLKRVLKKYPADSLARGLLARLTDSKLK